MLIPSGEEGGGEEQQQQHFFNSILTKPLFTIIKCTTVKKHTHRKTNVTSGQA